MKNSSLVFLKKKIIKIRKKGGMKGLCGRTDALKNAQLRLSDNH